jgi:hypothetical protein
LRDIAHRSATVRGLGAAALAAAAAVGAFAALTGTATAASTPKPPAIASAFTPSLIGVGATSAIGFTVTDPNASGSLTSVGFTDTLSGVTIDNPSGETASGCGASAVITSNPGDSTITLTGGTIKAGTPCTISVDVTAATAGSPTSQTTTVNSSAGSSAAGSAATLVVLPAPTVTVAAPTEGAKFKFGQKVSANYSCAQAAYTLGISQCTAEDDLGNTVQSGGLLDTTDAGDHQLTVEAFSVSGVVTNDTVDYTVLPDNVFRLKSLKASAAHVSFKLVLPGAGKIVVTEFLGHSKLASRTIKVRAAKSLRLAIAPSAALPAPAKVKLVIRYTPTGGVASTLTKRGIALT